MQAERTLVARILPASLQAQVLEATVRDAMDLVAHDGDSIATRAKRCISRRDFSAVLVVFPILKHLGELKPDLERTVEGCDYALRSKFASVLDTLNATVRLLASLYYYIKIVYIFLNKYYSTCCKSDHYLFLKIAIDLVRARPHTHTHIESILAIFVQTLKVSFHT